MNSCFPSFDVIQDISTTYAPTIKQDDKIFKYAQKIRKRWIYVTTMTSLPAMDSISRSETTDYTITCLIKLIIRTINNQPIKRSTKFTIVVKYRFLSMHNYLKK